MMQTKDLFSATLLALIVLDSGVVFAQTDVAANLYGAFSGATSSNGVTQSPSNSAGVMIELRHISNPIIGYEGAYSYNRADQRYTPLAGVGTCPTNNPTCGTPAAIRANAHEISGDWIVSVHGANLRPFALAGVGLLFNQPSSGQTDSKSTTKPGFIYGAGLDWGVLPHLGLRFQYRGNLYKSPDLTTRFTSVNAFTHTAEPMIGAYFRF